MCPIKISSSVKLFLFFWFLGGEYTEFTRVTPNTQAHSAVYLDCPYLGRAGCRLRGTASQLLLTAESRKWVTLTVMLRLRCSSKESRLENKEATCADHNNSNTSTQEGRQAGRQEATREERLQSQADAPTAGHAVTVSTSLCDFTWRRK